ncbi:MAG TPA: PepSY-associated TM helix domain-containing protein, partial [Polyangiaceae bacterium]|nr:PepSY-associated TM helix domain-containing protein [Polyangiaceae bacterium]
MSTSSQPPRSSRSLARTGRLRHVALLLHRYVGLTLVVFLVTAGLTGTVLAFNDELDAWISPELFEVPAAERYLPNLPPFEVAARVQASLPPGQHYRNVDFAPEDGRSIQAWVEEAPGDWRQWFVSPKSGQVLGKRKWGELSEGKHNLIPFVYRLHYSLGLGEVGTLLFGIAALLWTFDCFVGAYLTFPQPSPAGSARAGFMRRWLPAWAIRTTKLFSFVFTWHRASGLWVWFVLLIFAWSGVGFNLSPAYSAVMKTALGMQPSGHELLPELQPPFVQPRIGLHEAYELGRAEMAREAVERGFSVRRELGMYYADDHGAYAYVVESTLDVSKKSPRTEVYLNGQTGRLMGFSAATGVTTGNTVSSWLFMLHMGAVFGLWYQCFVSFMGLLVAGLSITGVWIWWRKRKQRIARKPRGLSKLVRPSEPPNELPCDDELDSLVLRG